MILKIFQILLLLSAVICAQQNLYEKYQIAKSYEAAGDYEKAETIYKEILTIQPWNSQYVEALNNLYLSRKQYDKSISFLTAQINNNPNDILGYGMLGTTYHTMGNYNKAFEIWDQAVEINPESANNYRIIANFATRSRAFDKAIDILRQAKTNVEDKDVFMYDIALLYSQTMKYKEAAEEYCDILKRNPESYDVVKNRIKSFLNNDEAFNAVLPVIREKFEEEENPRLLELESFIDQLNNDYRSALNALIKYDKITSNGKLVFNFAQTAYSEEEFEIASEAFNYFLQNYPEDDLVPLARIGFAKNKEAELNKKYEKMLPDWKPYYIKPPADKIEYRKIISTYRKIAEESLNNIVEAEAYYRIGLIYMTRFTEADSAIIYFNNVDLQDKLNSFSAEAILRKAEIMINRNKLDLAAEILNELESNNRRNTDEQLDYLRFLKSKIFFWQGKFKESVKLLSNAGSKMNMDYTNDAIELLMIINICKNDSLSLAKYASADFYLYSGDFDRAEEELNPLAGSPGLFVINQVSEVKLAEILCAKNKYKESIEKIDGYLKNEQNILFRDKMMYLLGNIYRYGMKDVNSAFKVYQKLLDIFPNSLYLSKSRESIKELNLN